MLNKFLVSKFFTLADIQISFNKNFQFGIQIVLFLEFLKYLFQMF
jgi:hypothetical protein